MHGLWMMGQDEVKVSLRNPFILSRWGKERPLNSRLLMQDVCLPDYDFSPMSHLPDSEAWNVQVFRSITSDAARLVWQHRIGFSAIG